MAQAHVSFAAFSSINNIYGENIFESGARPGSVHSTLDIICEIDNRVRIIMLRLSVTQDPDN